MHAVLGLAEYYDLPILRRRPYLYAISSSPIADFLELYQEFGDEGMATEVYHNRQRTLRATAS